MRFARRRFLSLFAGAAAAPISIRFALADAYPARPVRLLVPLAAGGPTDVFARLMAQKLSEQLGKQFYVENVPGAGGNIGTGRAAQSPPVYAPGGGKQFCNQSEPVCHRPVRPDQGLRPDRSRRHQRGGALRASIAV